MILYHTAELGPEFLSALLAKMGVTLFRDRQQGTNWVVTQ
jgi:hypothetical protein